MLVDTSLPPGPAARVLLTANGLYEPIAPNDIADIADIAAALDVPVEVPPAETGTFQIVTEPEGEAVEIVSTSQEGSEPVEVHNLDEVGATPTPATIQSPSPESAPEFIRFSPPGVFAEAVKAASEQNWENPAIFAGQQSESTPDATFGKTYGKPIDAVSRVDFIASGLCSDVEQYNDGRFCNAATEYRFEQWLAEKDAPKEQPEPAPEPIAELEPETTPVEPEEKPLYAAAWDILDAPMRLKDLAAALEVDADKLKASLQDPESTVVLAHAGWVKRREPKD
jgi:hypothetical protein